MNRFKMVKMLISLVVNAAVVVLGLRFLLRLFGANPAAPFVGWIYEASGPLLAPFRGIFINPQLESGTFLELSTLFAIVIYLLAGYFLEWLATLLKEGISSKKSS